MWTANLNSKTERTDGGVDFSVTFSDGTRKFEKTLSFFGPFSLGEAVKQEINRIQALHAIVDTVQLGIVSLPDNPPVSVNQTALDVQLLRKLQIAFSLGLVSSNEVATQADIVKKASDFMDFL